MLWKAKKHKRDYYDAVSSTAAVSGNTSLVGIKILISDVIFNVEVKYVWTKR